MKNKVLTFNFVLLVLVFTVASPLWATYWVDTSGGSANWASCEGETDVGSGSRCTLGQANANASAGQTVKLKGGTYSTYINPTNSGSSGNLITFEAVSGETVTISGTTYAIYLNNDDYIKVDGVNATNCDQYIYIKSSSYNEIANGSFTSQSSPGWDASIIYDDSQYNWLHDLTMGEMGECSAGGSDDGSVLEIGNYNDANDLTRYNLIEDCTFYWGGHHLVGLYTRYNTIRKSYFHNEAWSRGRGNRTMSMIGLGSMSGYSLLEGNRFGYAAKPCDDVSVGNVAVSTQYNILRFNSIYHNNAYGIGTGDYSRNGYSHGSYNKIYNNTIFNSGYNIDPFREGGSEDAAVTFFSWNNVGNVFKNNLYYENYQAYGGSPAANQTYANEYNGDVSGDPLFTSASTTPPADKTDSSLPDFTLQSGSPAIDQGGALTTVATADTGTGNSLVVEDARYFQDGSYGPPGTIDADWIAVGTLGNAVQISSISGNTIALANSITRNDNDPVWLYKKSDGVQVLYGSAPDAGAYEHGQAQAPSAPRNLRIIP